MSQCDDAGLSITSPAESLLGCAIHQLIALQYAAATARQGDAAAMDIPPQRLSHWRLNRPRNHARRRLNATGNRQ
jgi:hypothetical protein